MAQNVIRPTETLTTPGGDQHTGQSIHRIPIHHREMAQNVIRLTGALPAPGEDKHTGQSIE